MEQKREQKREGKGGTMTLEPETLTPELLAKIEQWRWGGDASRLGLNDIQALREIQQEEFEKKSEKEKNSIISEKEKVIKEKVGRIERIREAMFSDLKTKLQENNISEDEINFVLELKPEIASAALAMTKRSGSASAKATAGKLISKNLDPDTTSQLQQWQNLYKEEFNLDISKDIESLYIPEKQPGFNWLIIIHKSLTPNQIFNKIKDNNIPCGKYIDNLDEIEIIAQRPDTDIYAIWIRDRVEADEELKNLSANQIQEQNINSIILEERLLLELFYWRKEKKHLDLNNWTLCAGSRGPGGDVPDVFWSRGNQRLCVDWCGVSNSNDGICVRQAVSF